MERRKFLIGLGALSAGGAAAAGTGAFSNVQADRDVTFEVANDSEGLLGLDPTSDYAELNDQTLTLDFSHGDGGLNPDAVTSFDNLFEISNNGDEDIQIWFNTGKPGEPDHDGHGPSGDFHTEVAGLLNVSEEGLNPGGGEGANYGFYRSDLDDPDENFDDVDKAPAETDSIDTSDETALPPGTSVDIGFWISVPDDVDLDNVDADIGIWAYNEDIASSH